MNTREFFASKLFLRHLLLAAAAAIVLMWGALQLLDIYTLHNRTLTVPDLEGMHEEDLDPLLDRMNLRYVINDSIFDDSRDKGTVAGQDPAPGAQVKRNRTIYLTTVAILPEMVEMPDLTDLSLRQAMSLLEAHGLILGKLEYRPDIARNAVLQQKFKQGNIEPGTQVEKGTEIDLVLGEGLGENVVEVPMVIGMPSRDAIQLLNASSLNVGNEVFIDEEDDYLKVYEQIPDPLTKTHFLQAGSTVDLHYRSSQEFDFEKYKEELLTVPVPMLYGKTTEEVRETMEALSLGIGEEIFEGGVSEQNARVYRQEPEFEEDARTPLDTKINIWYRSLDEFDLSE